MSAPMPQLLPSLAELVPWTDRRGRFDRLRAGVLALLVLPGLYLAARWALGLLGPEPVNAAIHSTGYYAVWILLASLMVTPTKALGASPNFVVVRRLVGNAALIYAGIHLVLYCMDQHWRMMTIISEIVRRFYLTIGFAALLGLAVLGFTSTDGWVRYLGKAWKRLHRVVYALTVLGLFHYVLQSKLDVSQALLATGVFIWLMMWRGLPAGQDRSWPFLLAITAGAAAATLACEYLWYRFGTRINPEKVVLNELNLSCGPRPAVQLLLLGALATGLAALRRWSDAGPGAAVTVAVYGLGGLLGEAAPWFFGWQAGEVAIGEAWPWLRSVVWVALLATLGRVRWRLAEGWQKSLLDAVLAACVLFDVARLTTDDPRVVAYGAVLLLAGAALVAVRLRTEHRGAVLLLLLPLGAVLAYQAAG